MSCGAPSHTLSIPNHRSLFVISLTQHLEISFPPSYPVFLSFISSASVYYKWLLLQLSSSICITWSNQYILLFCTLYRILSSTCLIALQLVHRHMIYLSSWERNFLLIKEVVALNFLLLILFTVPLEHAPPLLIRSGTIYYLWGSSWGIERIDVLSIFIIPVHLLLRKIYIFCQPAHDSTVVLCVSIVCIVYIVWNFYLLSLLILNKIRESLIMF